MQINLFIFYKWIFFLKIKTFLNVPSQCYYGLKDLMIFPCYILKCRVPFEVSCKHRRIRIFITRHDRAYSLYYIKLNNTIVSRFIYNLFVLLLWFYYYLYNVVGRNISIHVNNVLHLLSRKKSRRGIAREREAEKKRARQRY